MYKLKARPPFILHLISVFLYFLILSTGLGESSGVGSHIHQVFSELPLLLLVYFLIYKMQAPKRHLGLKIVVAFLPITLLYLAYDYYFISFNTVFRLAYLSNVVELLEVVTLWQFIGLVIAILLPFIVIFAAINRAQIKWFFSLLILITGLAIVVSYFPKGFIYCLKAIYPGTFFEHTLVMDNGRFMSTLYYEAKRQIALKSLVQESSRLNDNRAEMVASNPFQTKDVFIVVLESFLEIEHFKDLKMQPLHSNLNHYEQLNFGLSRSPVFGGQTPRAEFEVLCGVPSFAMFGSNEFDFLEKGSLSCLPEILKNQGYLTLATNPYKPIYFSEANAYKNIGFEDINFLKPFVKLSKTYLDLEMPKKGFPYDGDVFDLNIKYLKQLKQKNPNKPIFNYVMSLYGHTPFYPAPDQSNYYKNNPQLSAFFNRALNMSAQTKQALGKYLAELKKLSPESIVLIVGDHLAPMPQGAMEYHDAGFLGGKDVHLTPRLFLINGEQQYPHEVLAHYQYFYSILNTLQAGSLCDSIDCRPDKLSLEPLYKSMMFKAIH